MEANKKEAIRNAVRGFYDLQQLKNQSGSRTRKPPEVANKIDLDEADQAFMGSQAKLLATLEKNALKEVSRLIADEPITKWLLEQRGVGPTMAGVILSEVDITRAATPSALWKFAGLHVVDGRRGRRQKGVKSPYNGFLKTKMVGVLADLFIKLNSPWREHYDNDKHRKMHQLVPECMACEGTGTAKYLEKKPADQAETPDDKERAGGNETTDNIERADAVETPAGDKRAKKKKGCHNCGGTGGPAPWGRSQAHRSQAAKGYMIKMFLRELWREWRTLEGLEVPPDYAEAYLGRKHGQHGAVDPEELARFRKELADRAKKRADDSETPVEKERAAS